MSMPLYLQQGKGSLAYIPTQAGVSYSAVLIIFILAHIPLALAMAQYPALSTMHAFGVLTIGLWWAISNERLSDLAYVGAYLTGAEVLWRMTDANVPWEFGKYATALVFVVALVCKGRARMPFLPTLYFALLLPAIVPTAMNYYLKLENVRQMASSNLSGPLALVVCAWFFSHVKLSRSQLESLAMAMIGPTVGIAVIALFSTITAENLAWGTESNVLTSGRFGPNQVSGALGLGALMAFMLLIRSRATIFSKLFLFLIMSFLVIQSALTFSRGGVYGAFGAAIVCTYYVIRTRQMRGKLFPVLIVIVLATALVLPALDNITGGALSARFENFDTTGRTDIAESDLRMWKENTFLGVGVGMSLFRDIGWKNPHTEFTRLLAEHGILGLGAMLCLLIAGWSRLLQTPKSEKAMVAGFLSWSLLFMLDKAMRLVAPSFMIGLAFATLIPDPEEQSTLTQNHARPYRRRRSNLAQI